MSDRAKNDAAVELGLRVLDAIYDYDVARQVFRYKMRAFTPTSVLEDLLDAATDTEARLAVLGSDEATCRIEARVQELGADTHRTAERLTSAMEQFNAVKHLVPDDEGFRRAVARWLDKIDADHDAVHGALRRRKSRREAEGCLGAARPSRKAARYSRLPKPELRTEAEPDNSRSAPIRYTEAHIAAYAEKYDSAKTVVRGQRMARPYIYAADGITVLCPLCRSERLVPIHEALVIDVRSHDAPLVAALGDGVTAEEFRDHAAFTWHCTDCGRWTVQQEIVGEDLRYCLQLVGELGNYDEPDQELCKALVDRLAWASLRLRDLSPAEFEKLAAGFLQKTVGPCDVHVVGQGSGRNDGGADLVLVRADSEHLVQVKHHPQRIADGKFSESVLPIRSLHGVMFRERIARGVFVTAADGYSRAAVNEIHQVSQAVPGYELQLYDRIDVSAWALATAAEDGPPWLPYMRSGRRTEAIASVWATPETLASAYPNARIDTRTDLK